MTHDNLHTAINVLGKAGDAISALHKELTGPQRATFLDVVGRLVDLKGRVIVTGMGKSGYIAHKLTATLASTGTQATYVHPAEASHGDLGMIGRDDAIIALSNSGETAELASIIDYARRFSILLIGITSNPDSTLARMSTLTLALPPYEEACPLGLAPTTSTTVTLALCDALAMTLLEHKGFTSEEFGIFHPGGKLGQKLVRVREVMNPMEDVPTVTPETRMSDVIVAIPTSRFGCAGVMENGELVGIITDGDLRRHMAPNLLELPARDVMTADPMTVEGGTLAYEVLGFMNEKRITSVFVRDEGNPVGLIHVHDLLRAGVL